MDTAPLTVTCPVGHEDWPLTSIKSVMDTLPRSGKQTARTVHMWCPAGHTFNLAKATKEGMVTKEQAVNILVYAQKTYEEAIYPLKPCGGKCTECPSGLIGKRKVKNR